MQLTAAQQPSLSPALPAPAVHQTVLVLIDLPHSRKFPTPCYTSPCLSPKKPKHDYLDKGRPRRNEERTWGSRRRDGEALPETLAMGDGLASGRQRTGAENMAGGEGGADRGELGGVLRGAGGCRKRTAWAVADPGIQLWVFKKKFQPKPTFVPVSAQSSIFFTVFIANEINQIRSGQ